MGAGRISGDKEKRCYGLREERGNPFRSLCTPGAHSSRRGMGVLSSSMCIAPPSSLLSSGPLFVGGLRPCGPGNLRCVASGASPFDPRSHAPPPCVLAPPAPNRVAVVCAFLGVACAAAPEGLWPGLVVGSSPLRGHAWFLAFVRSLFSFQACSVDWLAQ